MINVRLPPTCIPAAPLSHPLIIGLHLKENQMADHDQAELKFRPTIIDTGIAPANQCNALMPYADLP
jgi:hypothetical protein